MSLPSDAPAPRKRRSILRGLIKRLLLLGILSLAWFLWNPGDEIRDGRHDRRENGLWLAHGWIGGDDWFARHRKESEKPRYRSEEALQSLAARLKAHGIS